VKHSSAGVSDVSICSKKKTTTATATTDQMLSVHESRTHDGFHVIVPRLQTRHDVAVAAARGRKRCRSFIRVSVELINELVLNL
jgi:hypothetical protein